MDVLKLSSITGYASNRIPATIDDVARMFDVSLNTIQELDDFAMQFQSNDLGLVLSKECADAIIKIVLVKEKHDELIKQRLLTKSHYEGIVKQKTKSVQLILFIVDSGYTKHMTGNLKLLCSFVKKFLGTVHFGNDQITPILGYGDLVQGNIMINMVYYVEGLNHNLFSVGQFCDVDLESKGYRVYNKRTRLIYESIHIRFDEIKEMSETSVANDTSGLISKR
nr:integrase, catalytic region, zinc finger, CCHC-type, peptidase aspartic, catalytic [Tanacetum cinerariifolium]